MTPEDLFHAALEKPRAERSAFLAAACPGDEATRRRAEELLRAHDNPGSFLGSPLPAPTVDLPPAEVAGAVIGPYKLVEVIGEGGMGTVFLAQQQEPVKRLVALKVIKPGMDSRQVLARFEAERQALALMDHPHIARVLDAGATPSGRPYFVMELVKGTPITKYCDDHRLTPRDRLGLFVQVCQAVQHAHQKGVIHRDLKPSNVLVAPYDGKPVVKVIDFGVAKAAGVPLTEKTLVTGLGAVVGTPEYMSPEQAELNNADIDTRSDIYSLGVLLYELLTGTTPLTRKRLKEAALLEVLRVIREEEPPRPSTRLSTTQELPSIAAVRGLDPAKLSRLVRGELDWIVMKALEKDRGRRYETANGFASDIERYLADEPVLACPPSAGYRLRKFARRNKRALSGAAVLGAAVLLVAGTLGWSLRDRESRARQAAQERDARETAIRERVNAALGEAGRWMKQGKWREAMSAAERAEAALTGDETEELRQQVRDQLADLHLIRRLEECRSQREYALDSKRQVEAYARVFADVGIDVDGGSPREVAARIRHRAGTTVQVAAALDDWALVLRDCGLRDPKRDPAAWRRLLEIARFVDPDPWRGELRQWMGREDLNALRKLAAESDIGALPVQSLQLMGSALAIGGDLPACVAWLRRAHRQHPGDALLTFELAFHLGELPSADWAEVLRFAEAALAARQSPGMYNWVGVTLSRLGRHDEATVVFRKAIELHPDSALLHRNFGVTLHRQGKLDEAVAEYKKGIELDPKYAGAHYNLGIALHRQGKLDEAVAGYKKGIDLDPKNAVALNNLGRALVAQGKRDEAIAAYREGVRLDGNTHGAAINSLADILRAGGDPDVAVAVYLQIIRIDPRSDRAHFNLVDALRAKGGVDGAIAACKEALRLDPERAPYHRALGTLLLNQGDFDGAAAEYARADPLAGPLNVVAFAYACLFLIRGDSEGYDRICQHMVRRAGETKDSHEALVLARSCAVAHKTPVDPAQVVRWANQAAVSRNPWTFHVLGLAQYRAGQFEQALRSFDEADAKTWHARELNWFGRALAHHRLGHPDEARRCLDKGIQWLEREGTSPGQPSTLTLTPEDWLEGLLLRREAEAVLAEASAKKKD